MILNEKQNIIVTSGPTNERLDAVMKITNMSTGALGSLIADKFLDNERDFINKLYYVSIKLSMKPKCLCSDKLQLVEVESTSDLLNVMRDILSREKIHTVIHSAAVGDYKGDYSITASMLSKEITDYVFGNSRDYESLRNGILDILKKPSLVVNDEHKISSYETDLMFKLALTPKVISEIKKISPDTNLIGFKLLDGVSNEELISVASKLREKNHTEYIIANDLSQIENGKHLAYFVGKDGVQYVCETKEDIARTLRRVVF